MNDIIQHVDAWGIGMTLLAILAIAVIFGSCLWFIRKSGETNRRFRFFQNVSRRFSRRRDDAARGTQ